MKKSFLVLMLLGFTIPVFASDAVITEELVNLTPANVCYKASIAKSSDRTVLQKLSGQVPCAGVPGYVLPVLAVKKDGDTCKYTVGKILNFSTRSTENNAHNFLVMARCPTDKR